MTSPGARKRNTQGVLGKARRMRWLWRNIADWNLMTTFRPRVGAPIARSSVRRPATLPWITHTATHTVAQTVTRTDTDRHIHGRTGRHTLTHTDTDTQPHTHTHSVSPLGREHSKPAVQTHRQSNVGQHRARCEGPRGRNATTTADDEGRCLSLGDEHRDNSAEIAGHKLQLVPAHASRYGARETHTWKQYTHTQRGRRDACRCRCVEVAQHSGERAVRAK